ncbi:MAG: cytochrome P450 [Chloroflexi bacterium]|nr:cytochrome P450 [Chloroflexota bacterium]
MFDANFIANPYPTYHQMQANGRLHWIDFAGGAWLVPHYDDVMAMFRDARFSGARADLFTQQFPEDQRRQLREFEEITRLWLAAMNGEEHLRLRRLLNKAFTPRVVEAMRPRIQRLTNELIDEFYAQGEVELMHQFAHPLPAIVIAQLLGVPREDRRQFVGWSDHLATFFSSPKATIEQGRAANDALVAMRNYFRPIVAQRRQQPCDDLISHMIAVEEQGDMFTEDQLLSQCTLFLFAGHETTRNLIGNGVKALLDHPEQLELLRQNPDLLQSAIDEIVRYDCPVQLIPRIVTEDLELFGQSLKQGQILQLMLGAANRDAAQFPEPDRFDITRSYKRPASFGFGAHFCIGMPLAMMEIEIAFGTLIRRLPNLRLAGPAERSPNVTLRGFHTLPLAFDTVQAAIEEEQLVAV